MALGGHYITFKHVQNPIAVYKAANSDSRRIGTRDPFTEQVFSTLEWLLEQNEDEGNWKICRTTTLRNTDRETSEDLVFERRKLLQPLARHGYLTLMDATHNTNEMR